VTKRIGIPVVVGNINSVISVTQLLLQSGDMLVAIYTVYIFRYIAVLVIL
jgi:hypothetical protein